jgi:hypothetical protein
VAFLFSKQDACPRLEAVYEFHRNFTVVARFSILNSAINPLLVRLVSCLLQLLAAQHIWAQGESNIHYFWAAESFQQLFLAIQPACYK